MTEEKALIPSANIEIIEASGCRDLLRQIRPSWKAKNLIDRVNRLLTVDPSSACQRIFNASIHDLKEKIVVAGIDIACEAANRNKLPPITKAEDVENYPVSKIIDLAYRIGLLSRPEWRRFLRVYDIRKDLEHEDDEYEAGIEDCVYVFKTCVDVILSKDPIQLLKLIDVKEVVEDSQPAVLSEGFLEDYKSAPEPRQIEIYRFLISTVLNSEHPDIVRQNSYNVLGSIRALTNKQVIILCAKEFSSRIGRNAPDLVQARVAYAAGIFPYLKKTQLKEFFKSFLHQMNKIGHSFKSHMKHGELLRNFQEVGGLDYCPDNIIEKTLEWLMLCYIGEPSFGYQSRFRTVYYSNVGAPIALEIIRNCKKSLREVIEKLEKTSKAIKQACSNEHVARRFQTILDFVEK